MSHSQVDQQVENLFENTLRTKTYVSVPVNSWALIDAKHVKVDGTTDQKNNPLARITVNDGELIHIFDKNSRISKSLAYTSTDALAARLTGGKFFTINNELVDFRDNTFVGYVHDSAAIQKMIDIIGVSKIKNRHAGLKQTSTVGDIVLSHTWGVDAVDVKEFRSGGQFHSILRYNWSPFSQTIRGIFELVRLICLNGMVGVTDFFNAKIPVINRWEEHMDIAYKQIQNKIHNRVKQRVIEMGKERATVGELIQISSHASNRITKGLVSTAEERQRLLTIAQIADPKQHLFNYYKPTVFEDKSIANRLPGHLSTFDAWNMVTEMYSHTNPSPDSTDTALQRLANSLMFDEEKRNQRMVYIGNNSKTLSAFSSPVRAFFGVMD